MLNTETELAPATAPARTENDSKESQKEWTTACEVRLEFDGLVSFVNIGKCVSKKQASNQVSKVASKQLSKQVSK